MVVAHTGRRFKIHEASPSVITFGNAASLAEYVDEAFPRITTTRKPRMSPEDGGNGALHSNRHHMLFSGRPGAVESWRP